MTTMKQCPECGAPLRLMRRKGGRFRNWKYCTRCEWSELNELQDKIRQEIANGEGEE